MTAKLALLKTLLGTVTETDEELSALLDLAGDKVLRKRYPFGVPEGATVPSQYSILQVELAQYLYNKRGADYQESHNENGVSRTWTKESTMLRDVLPLCGSPRKVDADAQPET